MRIYAVVLLIAGMLVSVALWRTCDERETYHYALAVLVIFATVIVMAYVTFGWIVYRIHTEDPGN